jgi:hypothetical protein
MGNYPEESMQHSEQGESLIKRTTVIATTMDLYSNNNCRTTKIL